MSTKLRQPFYSRKSAILYIISIGFSAFAWAEPPNIQQNGETVTFTFSAENQSASDLQFDFKNAKPMPLPVSKSPSQMDVVHNNVRIDVSKWPPGFMPGAPGSGKTREIRLIPRTDVSRVNVLPSNHEGVLGPVSPQEYGSSQQVFTTSRVDPEGLLGLTRFYPFSAAGKLFFNKGADAFVCSASLIRPGIVVTAAHCLVNWGQQQVYSNFVFAPGYYDGVAPYGTWTIAGGSVLRSYFIGIPENCTPDGQGVVCNNDIGVLILSSQFTDFGEEWAGDLAGWMGYSWNGWGYNSEYQVLISQLGYPVNLDGGELMERTDSQGYVDFTQRINTIIGSLQTGGSSGGPWVLNLGIPPSLNNTSFGFAADHNMVAAVTSWGYTDDTIKQQGASSFTGNNILLLIDHVCPVDIGPCHP